MYYIAIDIGSTYIKSSLLAPSEGRILRQTRGEVTPKCHLESPLRFEVDMNEMMALVYDLLESYQDVMVLVDGIIFSTQQHGFVYVDPAFEGERYISWQDARCLEPMGEDGETTLSLLQRRITIDMMRPTGVYLKPALGACNLYTLIRERHGVISEGAKLYTLGSYIIEKLTGNNVCHITNAAPLGLVDIYRRCWCRELIERFGFERIELPRLVSDIEVCGWYEAAGRRIAVYPDVGDVQISVYGSGTEPGDVAVNMATAGQLNMPSASREILDADPRFYEIRPYFDGLYCHTISRMPSGRNLEVLVHFLRDIGSRIFGAELSTEEIWSRLDGCTLDGDTAGLEVSTAFYEMPEQLADGAIQHIDRANLTVDHLFSAAYRDMGRVYAHYLEIMARANGEKPRRMVFCGGAVRKNRQIQEALERATGLSGVLSVSPDEVHEGLLKLVSKIETQPRGAEAS